MDVLTLSPSSSTVQVRSSVTCQHCGQPVRPTHLTRLSRTWQHVSGRYSCGPLGGPVATIAGSVFVPQAIR
jgi:hypothetical protein